MAWRVRQPDLLSWLFLALLTNASNWTGAIVESFRAAAPRANGVAAGLAPSAGDRYDRNGALSRKAEEAMRAVASSI